MHHTRPPLRALLAFETSARLGSFRAAADELNLTPSAVSHQIRSLETYLGVALFDRIGRGATLSGDGRRYFESVAQCFAGLDEATLRLMDGRKARRIRDVVTVHTPPSFASKWLLPRLGEFLARHPDIDVRVTAEDGRTGFDPKAFDLAIMYKGDSREKENSTPILRETVVPLCSKAMLKRSSLDRPSDLLKCVLINTKFNQVTWKDWFRAQGIKGPMLGGSIHFDPSHVAIEAAVKGLGVVLESSLLAEADIEEGRLIAPFPHLGVSIESYYLHSSGKKQAQSGSGLFHQWLVAITAKHR